MQQHQHCVPDHERGQRYHSQPRNCSTFVVFLSAEHWHIMIAQVCEVRSFVQVCKIPTCYTEQQLKTDMAFYISNIGLIQPFVY